MNSHFITEIEIKNFKCFDSFEAKGFKRVNLIGGKNNVGKTTLLEVLYINANGENENEFLNAVFRALRGRDNFFGANNVFNESISNFYHALFTIRAKAVQNQQKDRMNSITTNRKNEVAFSFLEEFTGLKMSYTFNGENKNKNLSLSTLQDFFKSHKTFLKTAENIIFLRPIGLTNYDINELYGNVIELRETQNLNKALQSFDNDFEEFQIINREPKVFSKSLDNFISTTQLGDGAKKLINTFISLYSAKDGILLVDEIDNGIHYTQLDDLWKIILTIAEKQKVQVFATTHSKECIESYARVAKKLEDEDIAFVELCRNRDNELKALVLDKEMFLFELDQNHEVRGC